MKLVTDANAHEFSPAPKRRGRPPKVCTGGNVVTLADFASDRRVDAVAKAIGLSPADRARLTPKRRIEVSRVIEQVERSSREWRRKLNRDFGALIRGSEPPDTCRKNDD